MKFLIFSDETKFYGKTLRIFDDFVNFLLISKKNILILDKLFKNNIIIYHRFSSINLYKEKINISNDRLSIYYTGKPYVLFLNVTERIWTFLTDKFDVNVTERYWTTQNRSLSFTTIQNHSFSFIIIHFRSKWVKIVHNHSESFRIIHKF